MAGERVSCATISPVSKSFLTGCCMKFCDIRGLHPPQWRLSVHSFYLQKSLMRYNGGRFPVKKSPENQSKIRYCLIGEMQKTETYKGNYQIQKVVTA